MTHWDDAAIEDPEFRELSRSTLELAARIRAETRPAARKRRALRRLLTVTRDLMRMLAERRLKTPEEWRAFTDHADRYLRVCGLMGADQAEIDAVLEDAKADYGDFLDAVMDHRAAVRSKDPARKVIALRRLYAAERSY